MTTDSITCVEVAPVLILDAHGRILLTYNVKWAAFSLPMSKRKSLPLDSMDDTATEEPIETTALRAAVEVIGRPLLHKPQRVVADVKPYHASARDGTWKRYQYQLFAMRFDGTATPLPGHTAVWLSPEELETHEPISPTVREILRAVPLAEVKKTVGL